ncbi:hypothetical protein EON65_26620, partial [archaeon]
MCVMMVSYSASTKRNPPLYSRTVSKVTSSHIVIPSQCHPLPTVRSYGTEDRVKDESKVVAANNSTLHFVTFPGSDIKDLYVHEDGTPPPAPIPSQPT